MNKIEALNDIVTGLGGTGGYKYEIQALNAWAMLVGADGGYKYEIQALNAIDKAKGGTGLHKYNIDALNSICKAAGGSGLNKYEIAALAFIGSNVNPFDMLAPTDLVLTVLSSTSIKLDFTVNSVNADGHKVERSTDGVNYTEIATLAYPTATYTNTGLSSGTQYYYRVRAYKLTKYSAYCTVQSAYTYLTATLTSTGTGESVSTLRMEVSEDQTFEITSGTARFYTDAAGTLGESTTWNVTAGALSTIYLKAPSGSSVLNIPSPKKVIKWGNSSTDGWESSNNAASISIEVGKLALTEFRITGASTLIGALPTDLTYLYLYGNSIAWTYSGALPTDLTYLRFIGGLIAWTYTGALPTELALLVLSGSLINWTGLDVGKNGNIAIFNLAKYRTDKMSSPDMVTLLTQLTNRTGTLPATITINDYADYASPPQAVTDAVAALKIAKSITTVNLGA